ncbi:NAD(P)/FAD-dependent oxidoreductase [Thalassovita sp.]|uniref:flavin-containing monooxygenase n=1 Tax=Thalassovita sp. TaxID=1979401 RepID=UPI0029DE77CC|nr:NAD(P)/FAD-dependent oxidoreductase [Thalassovita sp.]
MQDVVVIGAGPAGLALGACLKAKGLDPLILEREGTIGSAWRRHYDRLHLHTDKKRSQLPMMPFPVMSPRYVPRLQVVQYLEDYAAHFDLSPHLNTLVESVKKIPGGWRVTANGQATEARVVIAATGISDRPKGGGWPGLGSFPGPVLHTRDYRRPVDLPGDRVLVVGFGNSGGEIAIDLAEDGRQVDMVVRSPVNLLPKELFGIPIGNFELLQRFLPYRIVDRITAPVLKAKLGDYAQYGLQKSPKGPVAQVREDGRIPLIDLGTLDLIKAGRITVRPGIDRLDGARIMFTDGKAAEYDAILMATGYTVDLRPVFGEMPGVLDAEGRPVQSGQQLAPGLWFCSYHAVPNGQLKEISLQAPEIAAQVAVYLGA